jgi:two-component system response regulator NreC
MSVRILIGDDHGVLRAGLRALLSAEPDFEVVGEAADGDEVLALTNELDPDLVLLDIGMPGPDGIQTARRLKQRIPELHVLMLTLHEDESLLRESLEAGASGYIVKRAIKSELIDAIRAVSQGHIYVHPAMMRALIDHQPSPRADHEDPAEPLTAREREVLQRVAQGYTNRQIAEEWTISVRTVESHRASIMAKLNLRSRAELVRYARERGLL